MDKKKLLFVVNGLYGGGAENIFQTVMNELDRDKYEMTVYSLHESDIDREIFRNKSRFRFIYKKSDGKGMIRKFCILAYNRFKSLIYENCSSKVFYQFFIHGKYDREIAFIEGYATRIISGSRNTKSSKIAWVHTDLQNNHWTETAYRNDAEEVLAYQCFDKVLCVSEDVRNKFIKKMNPAKTRACLKIHSRHLPESNFQTGSRVCVQHNPINERIILKKSNEKIPEKYRDGVMRFISMGRLEEEKGYERLLHVFNRLKNFGVGFEYWIIGDGKKFGDLSTYIEQNGLGNYVKLLGYRKNPYPYLAMADVLLSGSVAEGYSTVAVEALILGKPVITTDCAGMQEIFSGYHCGQICENSEDGMYDSIRLLLEDKGRLLKEYRESAKKRSKELRLEVSMKEIERILDE